MYLTPTEEDRLRVFTAAELARRTLARELRLNASEAVALVCDAMHSAARGGASLEDVMEGADSWPCTDAAMCAGTGSPPTGPARRSTSIQAMARFGWRDGCWPPSR